MIGHLHGRGALAVRGNAPAIVFVEFASGEPREMGPSFADAVISLLE